MLSLSAIEILGCRFAMDDSEMRDEVRERDNRLIDLWRLSESIVDAGYDRRTSGIGSDG